MINQISSKMFLVSLIWVLLYSFIDGEKSSVSAWKVWNSKGMLLVQRKSTFLLQRSTLQMASSASSSHSRTFILPRDLNQTTATQLNILLDRREPLLFGNVVLRSSSSSSKDDDSSPLCPSFDREAWSADLVAAMSDEIIEYDVRLSGSVLQGKRNEQQSKTTKTNDDPDVSGESKKSTEDIKGIHQSNAMKGKKPKAPEDKKKNENDKASLSSYEIESFQSTMREFLIQVPTQSSHEDSLYFMTETLLEQYDKTLHMEEVIRGITKALFLRRNGGVEIGDKEDDDLNAMNLFDYFPESIRPKSALIIGGAGARSFLHRDPYDWIGWNYLLEGKKLCKLTLSISL